MTQPNSPGTGSSPAADPATVMRVASMTQAMLDEVHSTPLDPAALHRLSSIHARALDLVRDAVPENLWEALRQFALPLPDAEPSDAELRIAQAALIGWLNGVLLGIQASAYQQAQAAINQQRTRAGERSSDEARRHGAYL
jgi:Bacterial proteasome activator